LLRAATRLDDDLLQLSIDFGWRENLVGEGAVPREDP
jgi:hypothetical protein